MGDNRQDDHKLPPGTHDVPLNSRGLSHSQGRSYDPRKGYNTERVHKKRVFRAREDAPADETRVTEGIVFASGQARPIALYSTEGEFIKYYPSIQHERMLAISDKHLHIREPYCKVESGCDWKGIILHLRSKEYPPKQIKVEHQ